MYKTEEKTRAGEPANFLAAPAPDFFSSGSGFSSGSWYFSQAAPAPFFLKRLLLQGAKNNRLRPAPAPDYWLSLPKYSFPRRNVEGSQHCIQVEYQKL